MTPCSATQCPSPHMHCFCSSPSCRPSSSQRPSSWSHLLHMTTPNRTQRQRNAYPPFSRGPVIAPSAVATDASRLATKSCTPCCDPHTHVLYDQSEQQGWTLIRWHPRCACCRAPATGICAQSTNCCCCLVVGSCCQRKLLHFTDERWQPWIVLLLSAQSLLAPPPSRRLSFLLKVW